MTVGSALLSFTLVAAVVTIIPGVDTALVLRTAVVQGRRLALATALGICTGALIWGTAAAAGISALVTASHTAFTVIRVAGAGYLLWLGAVMLRDAWRRRGSDLDGQAAQLPQSARRAFLRGLGTNLLNPKVGVFYAAMLPQFLPAGVAALPMGVLMALIHDLEAMVWFGLIIGGVGLARRWLVGGAPAAVRVRRAIDAVAGTVLIGLGVKLATSS
ncbi:threonine transporter RhtB [Catellatospora sp. TT07R-123]|uniref:LysE family translocator n=1 Tax=Catellatospora sp. TT07R-123 TaxID=2733863 RepID=UPI001B2ADF6D|nr:LysE family translocator [Catellatospora sp. TT07R-123]GHJ47784.1 threonine transporter RhtB [Catellatospora sp. TT07R-123]